MLQSLEGNFKTFLSIFYLCLTLGSVLSQELNNRQDNEQTAGSSYYFYQQPDYPRDCAEASNQCSTSKSGVYLIKPDGYSKPFEVYCDNVADSGGWTVIQRLQGGTLLFNRNWKEYKTGFGFLSQEFWIGHDKLSFLTNQDSYELRIDLTSANGLSFNVTYSNFRISDEYSEYRLTSVGEYSGTEDNITVFFCPSRNGGVYIFPDCSARCYCNDGQFTCDFAYQCSPYALCEETNNGSRCSCNTGYKGNGVNCTIDTPPSDCQDVYDRISTESGVYKIRPTTWQGEPFDIYCNMTDGGGWAVFQRRVDGRQNFHFYWSDYKDGFGTPDHEMWLGNDKLHSLTTQKTYQLRIDVVNSLGNTYYAKYSLFRVNDESDKYRLSVSGYSGNAGDQFSYNNGQALTTPDRDNENWPGGHCAANVTYFCGTRCDGNGAWWHNSCTRINLNNVYGSNCLFWGNLPTSSCNLKFTEMKVRPT